MKQFMLAALVCALLGVSAADKRPLRGRQSFAFQRQTETAPPPGPEAEDLTPPAPGAGSGGAPDGSQSPGGAPGGAPGGDEGGPYPPSGQPESGAPYPPSGWKPQGQRLELPPRQSWSQQQQQWGAKQPQKQYGAPPKQPQQQYGAPPKQPQQQYGAPPKQPQQQYGAPPKQPQQPPAPAEPESTEAPAAEPSTESPDQVAAVNGRLKQQLRQQRVVLLRLRQQVREQQAQLDRLQQLRGVDPRQVQEQQVQQQEQQEEREQPNQGQYVVALPDGRLQKVQFATTPSSTSVFKQSVPLGQGEAPRGQLGGGMPPTYVARLQFMDVPPIDAPVFSYSPNAPLVRVA